MRKTLPIFCILAIVSFVGCNSKNKEEQVIQNDTIPVNRVDSNHQNQRVYKFDTIYKEKDLVIIGDTTIDLSKINNIMIKFEPYITFDDYRVDSIFKGTKAKINHKSHWIAREYKTMITLNYDSDSLNFAGHYCFATWGCGCPCQGSAIVDLYDGKVYLGPRASMGYDFRKDSRMVIVNPPDSAGYYDALTLYEKPIIFIWDEERKLFKYKNGQPMDQNGE